MLYRFAGHSPQAADTACSGVGMVFFKCFRRERRSLLLWSLRHCFHSCLAGEASSGTGYHQRFPDKERRAGSSPSSVVTSAGSAEWIGVRVGSRGADLLLCRGGATQVISRSLGSKAGAGGERRMLRWQGVGDGVIGVRSCCAPA